MRKINILISFLILWTVSLQAQKHSISLNYGYHQVGFYNNIQFRFEDDTPYPPDNIPVKTYKQKMSKLNRITANLTYTYQWTEKWRFAIGIRECEKGYGWESNYFFPKTKQSFTFDDENYLPKAGLIFGVENTFLQKNRFGLSWQAYFIPEANGDFKLKEGGLSLMGGLKAEWQLWKSLHLVVHPFGEVGVMPYDDDFLDSYKPFGFGCHIGLSVKF